MKPSNIKEIIAAGEGLHVEFKEAHDRLPGSFFDTVCAFLNTDGGTIYLGVGDNGWEAGGPGFIGSGVGALPADPHLPAVGAEVGRLGAG